METLPEHSSDVRLLRIDFCPDTSVADHPEVARLMGRGWRVKRMMPRLIEKEGGKLFIVLTRPIKDARL